MEYIPAGNKLQASFRARDLRHHQSGNKTAFEDLAEVIFSDLTRRNPNNGSTDIPERFSCEDSLHANQFAEFRVLLVARKLLPVFSTIAAFKILCIRILAFSANLRPCPNRAVSDSSRIAVRNLVGRYKEPDVTKRAVLRLSHAFF